MRVLFDHNVDRRFRGHLPSHQIRTAREMGWDKLENGELLRAAAAAAFDCLLSIDKNLEHEQNLRSLPLPVIILNSSSNALPAIVPFAAFVLDLLQSPLQCLLHIIEPSGAILRLTAPR